MPIKMRHPDIPTYAEHFDGFPEAESEEQFAEFAKTGWQRVPDDATDYSTLTVDELKALVEQVKEDGREVKTKGAKKADLVAALEADRDAVRRETEVPAQIQGP